VCFTGLANHKEGNEDEEGEYEIKEMMMRKKRRLCYPFISPPSKATKLSPKLQRQENM
jgi:hypothetical protein